MTFFERAQAAILRSGGRMTAQRRVILETIAQGPKTWDAETLYAHLQEISPGISLATVYRTLNLLTEEGILKQRYVSREHTRAYFERSSVDQVFHFTCRQCRQVISFHSDLVMAIAVELEAAHQVNVHGACVCFDGLCANCLKKAENPEHNPA